MAWLPLCDNTVESILHEAESKTDEQSGPFKYPLTETSQVELSRLVEVSVGPSCPLSVGIVKKLWQTVLVNKFA